MWLEGKHNVIVSYDIVSSYPAMGIEVDDAPDLDNHWHLNFYKMPLGVLKSNLKKDGVSFYELTSMDNDEKVLDSEIGSFYFRRGGRGNSWLCYKYLG